eukprot:Gb_05652 [translate_table: standard]
MEMTLNRSLHSEEALPLEEEASQALPLPTAFLDFLSNNGVDPSVYSAAQTLPRYIRLKPGIESEIPEIESEIGCKLEPVLWLPGFFSIPQQAQIASSEAYRKGKVCSKPSYR